jgi:hypothetical protein
MHDIARAVFRKKDLLESLGDRGEITLKWILNICDELA